MSPDLVVGGAALTAAVAVIAVVLVLLLVRRRRRRLRERFGPEYVRLVVESGGRRTAERELARRMRRYRRLRLRQLTPEERREYTGEWAHIQEGFVDGPAESVQDAEQLVARLAAALGFPSESPQQRLADLSVEYPEDITHYRSAHEIQEGEATTENLRLALICYREFLSHLLAGETDGQGAASVPPPRPRLVSMDAHGR